MEYQSTITQLGDGDVTQELNEKGFFTIFDIIADTCESFAKANPGISGGQAEKIYNLALGRAESLKQLSRAWKLHNDPVINGIPLLHEEPAQIGQLNQALSRTLGSNSSFDELFPEQSAGGYADATSVQSLFSPGRYVTLLYKVAQKLHDDESNIDQRRPDIKDIVVSDYNKDNEVTTLDLLLEALDVNLDTLKTSFSPMQLVPYDDDLQAVRTVLGSYGLSLAALWDTVAGPQALEPASIPRASNDYTLVRGQSTYFDNEYQNESDRITYWMSGSTPLVTGASTSNASPTMGINYYSANSNELGNWYLTLFYRYYVCEFEHQGIPLAIVKTVSNPDTSPPPEGALVVDLVPVYPDDEYWFHIRVLNANGTIKGYLYILEDNVVINNISYRQSYSYTDDKAKAAKFKSKYYTVDKEWVSFKYKELYPTAPGTVPPPVEPDPDPYPEPSVSDSSKVWDWLGIGPTIYERLQATLFQQDIFNSYNVSSLSVLKEDATVFCRKTGLSFNELIRLTAQQTYQNADRLAVGRYLDFGKEVPVTSYGARYLNAAAGTNPFLVSQTDGAATPTLTLNSNADITTLANAEKLVRLRNAIGGIEFHQLDQMIAYINQTIDSETLGGLADFCRLREKYGITPEDFCAFIDEVSSWAEAGQKSQWDELFTSPDGSHTLPYQQELDFALKNQDNNESIVCSGLKVTPEEALRIAQYVGGSASISLTRVNAGRMYRLARIPRLFGLTFSEMETIWKIMRGGSTDIIIGIAQNSGLGVVDSIDEAEQMVRWMQSLELDAATLQAMITTEYSTIADAAIYNFLESVYTTHALFIDNKLFLSFGAHYNVKSNIMLKIFLWQEQIHEDFTRLAFVDALEDFFTVDHTDPLADLENEKNLIRWVQQISQLVIIAKWAGLTEQDMNLIVISPYVLLQNSADIATPTIPLLQSLARYKDWLTRLTVSSSEAVAYLTRQTNHDTPAEAAKFLAAMHGWDEEQAADAIRYIYGEDAVPVYIQNILTLENWIQLAAKINVGINTVHLVYQLGAGAQGSTGSIPKISQDLLAGAQ